MEDQVANPDGMKFHNAIIEPGDTEFVKHLSHEDVTPHRGE